MAVISVDEVPGEYLIVGKGKKNSKIPVYKVVEQDAKNECSTYYYAQAGKEQAGKEKYISLSMGDDKTLSVIKHHSKWRRRSRCQELSDEQSRGIETYRIKKSQEQWSRHNDQAVEDLFLFKAQLKEDILSKFIHGCGIYCAEIDGKTSEQKSYYLTDCNKELVLVKAHDQEGLHPVQIIEVTENQYQLKIADRGVITDPAEVRTTLLGIQYATDRYVHNGYPKNEIHGVTFHYGLSDDSKLEKKLVGRNGVPLSYGLFSLYMKEGAAKFGFDVTKELILECLSLNGLKSIAFSSEENISAIIAAAKKEVISLRVNEAIFESASYHYIAINNGKDRLLVKNPNDKVPVPLTRGGAVLILREEKKEVDLEYGGFGPEVTTTLMLEKNGEVISTLSDAQGISAAIKKVQGVSACVSNDAVDHYGSEFLGFEENEVTI